MTSTIECSCEIDAPIAQVFAFHLDTRNAARIAPPGQRVVSVEGEFPLRLGSEVRLRARQLPLPWAQTWLVRVARLEEPTLIVDELLRGPFAAWRHEHHFAALPGGRTRLTDHVTYELRGGAFGRLAGALAVRRLLLATFRSRQARTRSLLEAEVTAHTEEALTE
ncbi:MAG: SRPBCC family protein [Actinomycetota bacterium]|nr:SRPBCC family protein [Actinomycetota bacterium]